MSSETWPLIGGRTMRGTVLDSCGVPDWGDRTQIVSDGFVSIAVTANYDDGEEVVVRNARGRRCVQRDAEPELINLALTATFCAVDPEFYTLFTGQPKIVDPATGNTIGFDVDSSVRPSDVRAALEVWADAQGTEACDPSGDVPYGYLLWPFLQGGRVSDYTIENGAVTFQVSQMLTKKGSQWDVGPYLVQTDEAGDPSPLIDVITGTTHQRVFRTTVAPPENTGGLIPLDDPDDTAATSATAGTPGTWDGVRPATLAALQASTITSPSGASAWTTGQYVILGDGSLAHWAGSSATPKWVTGKA